VVKGEMLVMGGENERHWPFKDLFALNLATLTWMQVDQYGLVPPSRCYHTSTVIDNKLYVFGGTDGKSRRFEDLSILDTDSWSWSRPTLGGNAPLARSHHSTTFLGTSIFVFGGSAGYGKGCLSDFIRLEFDGLSSWSGPNIERLAIEHSVVKEQCASIANNRDAESRVHSEVVSSLDDTIIRLKGELIQEQEMVTGYEMKLGDAVHEIATTQKEVLQLQHEKMELQEHVQDMESQSRRIQGGATANQGEIQELQNEKRVLLQAGFKNEAMLKDSQEANLRHTAQIKSLQDQLSSVTEECRETCHREASLKLQVSRINQEMERLKSAYDEALRRQLQSDKARLAVEENLEQTTAQLSSATVNASAVYEKSRTEFAATTSNYEEELSTAHKARTSLETSLSIGEKSISQLQARLAEMEAIHTAAAASNQRLDRQVAGLEEEHRSLEGELLRSRQECGILQGEKTVITAELSSERSRSHQHTSDLITIRSDLKAEQIAKIAIQKQVDKLEIENKSETGRRESAERQIEELRREVSREVDLASSKGRSEVQLEQSLRSSIERDLGMLTEQLRDVTMAKERVGVELGDSQQGMLKIREEHDLLLERYAAQVHAFEDLQTSKSTMEDEMEGIKTALEQSKAETAVAAAANQLAKVCSCNPWAFLILLLLSCVSLCQGFLRLTPPPTPPF